MNALGKIIALAMLSMVLIVTFIVAPFVESRVSPRSTPSTIVFSSGFEEDSGGVPQSSQIYLVTWDLMIYCFSREGAVSLGSYPYPPTGGVPGGDTVWYNEQGLYNSCDTLWVPDGFLTPCINNCTQVDSQLYPYIVGHKTGFAYRQSSVVRSGSKAAYVSIDKETIGLQYYGKNWSINCLNKYLYDPNKISYKSYALSGWFYIPYAQVGSDELQNQTYFVGLTVEKHDPQNGSGFTYGIKAFTNEVMVITSYKGQRIEATLGKIPYSIWNRWIKITLYYDFQEGTSSKGCISSPGKKELTHSLQTYLWYELPGQTLPSISMWNYFWMSGYKGRFYLDDVELVYYP